MSYLCHNAIRLIHTFLVVSYAIKVTHSSLCALVGVMTLLLPWQHPSYKSLNIIRIFSTLMKSEYRNIFVVIRQHVLFVVLGVLLNVSYVIIAGMP